VTAQGRRIRSRGWRAGALGLALTVAALWLAPRPAIEAWYLAFVLMSGIVTGSLGLLMIGHLMSEEWLMPIRDEAEAAALTAPLLPIMAVPLGLALDELFPWAAAGAALNLPRLRAAYLSAPFLLVRSILYLSVWCALAFWITRVRDIRRASAIGLALLAPTAIFAANDWVLSRDPLWWSSLFGFSFALSQLLAALSVAILITLLSPEHPGPTRMQSLERALLTLALLVLWAWFAHFLIVWLANLPNEAAWYLRRSGAWLWAVGVAVPTLLAAVAILVPPGFGRRTMIVGSALLLIHHVAHMLWLTRPSAADPALSWMDVAVVVGLGAVWAAWFGAALQRRRVPEAGTRASA
jgi:hypothetical protein